MSFFTKLKKYAKAPLKKMKKDYTDPAGATKQLLNDPLGRVKEEFTGEVGDVLPIVPQDPLADIVVEPYADILGNMDPLALPDEEMLRLKARRNQGPSQRERNTLTQRRSAFIPDRRAATQSKKVSPINKTPVGYYDTRKIF